MQGACGAPGPQQPRSPWGGRPGGGGVRGGGAKPTNRKNACRRSHLITSSPHLLLPPSQSPTPILVDFHAAWCGPCRLMSDSIATAAKELGSDTVTVIKIDTDAYPALASRFRVAALPTLLLFRGGAPVDRVEGYLAPADLAQRVRYYCQSLDLKFGRR